MSSTQIANIPVSMIKVSQDAMRLAKRDDESYAQLRDNIQQYGMLSSIAVVERKDASGKVTHYDIADGVQRYSCACDLQWENIPAIIGNFDEHQMRLATIAGNLHGVETKPIEYTKHLYRIIAGSPSLTISDLAKQLNTTATFLNDRLSLKKLDERYAPLVNDGTISITNAIWLSRIPKDEQEQWVQRAQTDSTTEFVAAAKARVDEIRKANREGRKETENTFSPTAHLVKAAVLRSYLTDRNAIVKLLNTAPEGQNVNSPVDAIQFFIKHIHNIDELGIAEQKSKYEARVAELARQKEERKKEKEKKAAEKAASVLV